MAPIPSTDLRGHCALSGTSGRGRATHELMGPWFGAELHKPVRLDMATGGEVFCPGTVTHEFGYVSAACR